MREDQGGPDPDPVAPLVAPFVVAPQGHQGRHPADAKQRQQREDHRDPETQPHAEQYRGRGRPHLHVDGKQILQQRGQDLLHAESDQRADRAAQARHRQRLHQVDHEDLAGRGAEAPQHRDGVELLADEDVHGARDTESAQQQRDQRHEAEVVAHPREGIAEVVAIVLDALDPNPFRPELRPVRLGERAGPRGISQLDEGFVIHPGSEPDQACGGQITGGDVDPGTERRRGRHVAGHTGDGPPDLEPRVTEGQRVAAPRIESGEQAGIQQDAATLVQRRPASRRFGADGAVERPAGLHGRHLHEAHAPGAGDERHRVEAGDAGNDRGTDRRVGGAFRCSNREE